MTYWVNVYDDGQVGIRWKSREQANKRVAHTFKLAYRIKVTLKGKA